MKWPSGCRQTCTWYKLLLPHGRKPRNQHSRAVLRNRLPKWHCGRTSSLSPSCQRLHAMTNRSNTRSTALRPEPWPFSTKPDKGFNRIFGKCCTRPWSFITPRPVQCLHCQAMSSEVALFIARRNGGLSFHTSPVTQFRRPKSLAQRFPCASKTRPSTGKRRSRTGP